MTTYEIVAESNLIEGINRPPTAEEMKEHDRFMGLNKVTIKELIRFVSVYTPGAKLRLEPGMDVMVGEHIPRAGGPLVEQDLEDLLDSVEFYSLTPWEVHVEYEKDHPFMDGNGRSGRVLWYWMMGREENSMADLGFLHAFYYQTLERGL